MKINTHKDLPVGKELWLGPSHQQFCNRYLRREDGMIEVQNIHRYGKKQKTNVMTPAEFDAWREHIRNCGQ